MNRWVVVYGTFNFVHSSHFFKFMAKYRASLLNNSNAIRLYPVYPGYSVQRKK